MKRFLAILVILGASCLSCLTINSLPKSGVLEGTCVDSSTGDPIDGATVEIDLNNPTNNSYHNYGNPGTDNNDDLFSQIPDGWSQGSQNDSDLDIAGHQNIHKTHWEVVTDENGRFLLHSITVGSYTITASSSGHQAEGQPLAVAEGYNEPVTVDMDRSADSLNFDTPSKCWTTDQYPSLGLNGLLSNLKVQFTLERLDTNELIKKCPKLLLLDQQQLIGGKLDSTKLIRKWTSTIDDADDEGSFYYQVPCFDEATGKPTPGVYQLTATSVNPDDASSTINFIVTDLAIVAKSYSSRVQVHAVDSRTGKSVAGLDAYCLNVTDSSSRDLSKSTTNVDGLCTLSSSGSESESQGIVLIRHDQQFAAAETQFNSPGTVDEDSGTPTSVNPSDKDLRAFIYTDRPVYRPGQPVYIKGISRWFVPGTGFVIPSNTRAEVVTTDAQNTIVNRQTITTNRFGSWTGKLMLSGVALTGAYTITETIGNQSKTGTFSVAAYHKPEYQVSVTFDKQRYIKGDVITATVTGTYYFGAPMSGATGSVEIYSKPSAPGEDDDDASNNGDFVKEDDIKLDGNGQATVTIDTSETTKPSQNSTDENGSFLNMGSSQVTYSATANIAQTGEAVNTTASVVVAQGDFSIAASASSTIANIGDEITVTGQAADQNGKAISGKRLNMVASYDIWKNNQDVYTQFISTDVTTGADGNADYSFRPGKAGLIDVKFSGVDDRGNKVNGDTQIWVPSKDSDISAQYADMSILLDKDKYKPGDVAHILITTAHPGPDAMVTVEGTSLYKTMIVPLTRRATQVDLPVAEDYAPGVTIAVSCIADKQFLSSTTNLAIDDPKRTLNISLTPDKTRYHPGDPATVAIHTSSPNGSPVSADVSVAIVDSAIFSIMPEPPGTITDAFLPQQSDLVQTADSTETVYYGDVDKGSTDIDIRRKFPDTALWDADIVTNSHGNAAINVVLPDNLTTWKITSYGQTANTMVGKGVGEMVVNKDLTVSLETPPFLVQGDKSTMNATIHNNTSHTLSVNFNLRPGGLSVDGDLKQNCIVAPNITTTLTWSISAAATGAYLPEATVQSGALNDGVQGSITVGPHGAKVVNWQAGTALAGANAVVNMNPRALRSSTELSIRLSPTLAASLPPAAEYLSSYPYGCTDSISSALIADSTLYKSHSALNLPDTVQADLKQKAERCLLRLNQEQQNDGGWGWFSVDGSDVWMTSYASYGLTLAAQSGLAINQSIMQAALKACAQDSQTEMTKVNYRYVDTSSLALAALVLAENGSAQAANDNLNYLIKLWEGDPLYRENHDVAIAALAEYALHTPKSVEEAKRLMASLWSVGRETGAMLSWTEEYHSSASFAGQYAPDTETTAWALLAAQTITPGDARIDEAARWLASNRNDDHWTDLGGTGIAVLALSKYIAATKELTPNMRVAVTVNGRQAGSVRFTTASIGDPDYVVTISGKDLSPGVNYIEITKVGKGRLYYALKMSQTIGVPSPQAPAPWIVTAFNHVLHPMQSLPPTASGYRIKRVYMRMTSRRNFLWEDTVPTRDWQFDNGDSILVRLIIDAARPGSRIVIDEPVPPGCRIAETSGEYDEDWDNWWDYTDVRDSDIVFFISDLTKGRHEIDYHLVANRAGQYDVMPTSITSMVDPTLQVTGASSKVEVNGN